MQALNHIAIAKEINNAAISDYSMIRRACVAGQFYAGQKEELIEQIKGCFCSEYGPEEDLELIRAAERESGKSEKKKHIEALIVPHAGYAFSGPCAAHAYAKLAKAKTPKTIILIGPSHHGHESCLSAAAWETPLGIVEIPAQDVAMLSKELMIAIDEDAHMDEHSLEVQMPFLQYIYSGNQELAMPKIIPLLVGIDGISTETIKNMMRLCGPWTTLIISSDFSHIGPAYGYEPFEGEQDAVRIQKMKDLDIGIIYKIMQKDVLGLKEELFHTRATICGITPIIAVLPALKGTGKLLRYYNSGDIIDDYTNAVGYGAIIFE